jgi:hypothetical protein
MIVILACSSLFVLRLGFLCVYHYPLLLSGRVVLYELCTFATQEHFGGFADFGSGVKMFPSSQIVPCNTEVAVRRASLLCMNRTLGMRRHTGVIPETLGLEL